MDGIPALHADVQRHPAAPDGAGPYLGRAVRLVPDPRRPGADRRPERRRLAHPGHRGAGRPRTGGRPSVRHQRAARAPPARMRRGRRRANQAVVHRRTGRPASRRGRPGRAGQPARRGRQAPATTGARPLADDTDRARPGRGAAAAGHVRRRRGPDGRRPRARAAHARAADRVRPGPVGRRRRDQPRHRPAGPVTTARRSGPRPGSGRPGPPPTGRGRGRRRTRWRSAGRPGRPTGSRSRPGRPRGRPCASGT